MFSRVTKDAYPGVDESRHDYLVRPLCQRRVGELGLDGEGDMLEPIEKLILQAAAAVAFEPKAERAQGDGAPTCLCSALAEHAAQRASLQ
jgi:hypothetical protein